MTTARPFTASKKARLYCIRHHLRDQFKYTEVEHPAVVLPERLRHADYSRNRVPAEIIVPEMY